MGHSLGPPASHRNIDTPEGAQIWSTLTDIWGSAIVPSLLPQLLPWGNADQKAGLGNGQQLYLRLAVPMTVCITDEKLHGTLSCNPKLDLSPSLFLSISSMLLRHCAWLATLLESLPGLNQTEN